MKKRIIGLIFSFCAMTILATDTKTYAFNIDEATRYYNMGIDYYSQNQVEDSIDSFKKAISLSPDFYEAYYNLGKIQLSYGYHQAAIKTYTKLLDIAPEDYESVFDMATACYKSGQTEAALQWLEKIPSHASNFNEATEFLAKVKAQLASVAKEQEQTMATIQAPSGVAINSKGVLFVASFSENKVYAIANDKTSTVYADGAYLGGPIGLTLDKDDNLYVANYTKNNIVKITPTGVISEFAQVKRPYCVSVDDVNNALVVSEQEKNRILKFELPAP